MSEKMMWSFSSKFDYTPRQILVKECKTLFKVIGQYSNFYRTNICKDECFDSKNDCINYVLKILIDKRRNFSKEIENINNDISKLLELQE